MSRTAELERTLERPEDTAAPAAARAGTAPRRLPLTADQLGCRTFSASLHQDRGFLGERVTAFLRDLRAAGGELSDYQVSQSSDASHHCLSIVLFYTTPAGVRLGPA